MNQRVLVLIGDNLRHKFVFQRLMDAGVNVVGLVVQERLPDPVMRLELSAEDQKGLDYHFGLRDEAELSYFGYCAGSIAKTSVPVFSVPEGQINDASAIKFASELRPDTIVVYGTRLLKDDWLMLCPGRVINLHLGLSPYYRGAATIFWPLYNDEPEYVGATIHQIDLKIDTGSIFHHVRPEIVADDNPHTIGCKTVQVAADGVLRTLWEVERGDAISVPQWEKKDVYLQRHFQPQHAREIYEKLADGLLARYLERKDKVYYQMRLIG